MNRPPTSGDGRPASGFRPYTTTHRQPSANTGPPPSRGPVPGTASRLISAASSRSGTRMSTAQGIGIVQPIMVNDRPMSQQGLAAPKTGHRTPQRQVQDKSYFMGLLRSKISELTSEISKLAREIESLSQEQSTYVSYERRAEALASELKTLQGELADYNLLVDKINTDAEMDDIQQEYLDLKAQNEQEATNIEQLFEERQAKETQVKQLEKEIEEERHMADNLISAMKPELRQRYSEQKQVNQQLQSQLEVYQQQLDALNARRTELEEQLSLSQVKQEAVSLYEKLRELEARREVLLEEEKNRGTPAQEREKLLKQVKEDNAELSSIERQISEIREQIEHAKQELFQLEQDVEDKEGERSTKYRELKKREETIDAFLASFDENKASEETRRQELESSIVSLLERISRSLAHFQHLPSQQELAMLKDDLAFKEKEMEKSRNTVSSLSQEQKKLSLDLQKIEQLETKIQQELETLRQKIQTMEEEMVTYSDIAGLRARMEEKSHQLTEQQQSLQVQRDGIKKLVSELNKEYEAEKAKLYENETFTQLQNLERRWQHQEQNNFAMKEFIAAKMAETDSSATRKTVYELLDAYNKCLQDNLAKTVIG